MNDLFLVLFYGDAFSFFILMTVVGLLLNLMVNSKYLTPQISLFRARLLIILLLIAPGKVATLLIFHELLTKVSADDITILIYVKTCGVELQSKE